MRVVVIDASFPSLALEEAAAREAGATFHFANTSDPERIAEAVAGASVVLVQYAQLRREALERLAAGARIIRYGVGFDNIDLAAARELGIEVAYIPDYCTDEVADHTASMILCLLRRIVVADKLVREGSWSAVEACRPLKPFPRTVVGFLGFGRIARAVHDRLRPFGFDFIYCDPAAGVQPGGARSVGLGELFARSDILSLHAPSNAETRYIVDAARIATMHPEAMIVNTARGDLIDTQALAVAIAERRLGGAALDVFEQEPLGADHPIRSVRGVILTPHAAWYSDDSIGRLQGFAADEIRRGLDRRPPRQPVPFPPSMNVGARRPAVGE